MRLGADPAQLTALASRFERDARRLDHAAAELAGATAGVWWLGPARHRMEESAGRAGRALRSVADELGRAGTDLRSQALQQIAASGGPGAAAVRAVARQRDARLLDLDPAGDGRIVVASGDPDRAAEVIVLVPGAGTTLASTPAMLRRIDTIREATQEAMAASGSLSAGHGLGSATRQTNDDVAVIAWLGYDAPGPFDTAADVRDLVSDRTARSAARDLRRFIDRWSADGRRVVLLGHSYGSLVSARAARGDRHVSQLVVVGSPGLGVDRARDLHLAPGVEVVAGTSAFDPVGHTGWFGRSPTAPGFGARVVDLTDHRPGHLTRRIRRAHTAYFDRGAPMMAELAQVLALSEGR